MDTHQQLNNSLTYCTAFNQRRINNKWRRQQQSAVLLLGRHQSTNSYQFDRARKLNRSARAESKHEISYANMRCKDDHGMPYNRWQSIAALGVEDNFSRLKKSYATMRKSFRLQLSSNSHKRDLSDFANGLHCESEEPKRNIMGQLGSGAAKLLRGVYAKGQQAYNNQELDTIRFTDGSFKVLSPTLFYEAEPHDSPQDNIYASQPARKSAADLEIEQRLRRSKLRVLPSAQYQAPESEKACEGLNMEELEEIKRDNLRMTILKTQRTMQQPTVAEKEDDKIIDGSGSSRSSSVSGVELTCSCKDIGCADSKTQPKQPPGRTESPSGAARDSHYCTCASISSSFSSLNRLIEFEDSFRRGEEEDNELPSQMLLDQNHKATSQKPPAALETIERLESRASEANFLGDKIEDRLKAMFDSIGHKLEFLGHERDFAVGNGCVEVGLVDSSNSQSSSSSSSSSICVGLSPKTEQKQLLLFQQEQQNDTKIYNQLQQSYENAKVRNLPHSAQKQQATNHRGERLADSDEQEAAASDLGGANLNGQITSQQVNSSSSSRGGQRNGGTDKTTTYSTKSSDRSNPPAALSYSHQSNFKGNNDNAIELVSGKQLACHGSSSGTICHQYGNHQNTKQQHLIKEQIVQSQLQNLTLPSECLQTGQLQPQDKERAANNNRSILTKQNTKSSTLSSTYQTDKHSDRDNYNASNRAKDHRELRRPRQPLANLAGDETCACRHSRAEQRDQQQQQQLSVASSNQMAPETCDGYLKASHGDEHLYDSISGSLTPSPERRGRQRQLKHQVYQQDPKIHHNQLDYQLNPKWQPRHQIDEQELIYEHNEQSSRLFGKQLKNDAAVRQEFSQIYQQHVNNENIIKQTKTKRSLLGRIKDMIVPTGKANKQTNYEWPAMQNDEMSGGTLKLDRRSKSSRWQRSATLTTRSTQNLITGNLNRCLSNSKKSINIDDGGDVVYANGHMRPLTSAGFITLGRRAAYSKHNTQNTADYQLASQIFPTKSQGLVHLDRCRFGGSVDSLPSADSGLSCSNLQNSGSSDDSYAVAGRITSSSNYNLYSKGPTRTKRDDGQHLEPEIHYPVIGKARAMVDCNPCAYDKEALVFKQGDIIDILERNQTGTWVGHCNGQMGHFKFINVTELTSEGEAEEEEVEKEKEKDLHRSGRGQERNNGVYVTKLEIRSNNNNIGDQIKCKIGPEPGSSTIDRRSKSMSTINQPIVAASVGKGNPSRQGEGETTTTTSTITTGHLSSSNETIMSSLEQLLFAIGLAGEHVTVNRKSQMYEWDAGSNKSSTAAADHGDAISGCNGNSNNSRSGSKRLGSKWSYLNVLNRGGINNLDSFSAIDDWHELEQIGIVDDEHQRRLLMAARIIRQASQAAKLDFVENHRTKSEGGASGQVEEVIDCNESQTARALAKDGGVTPDARKRTITTSLSTTTTTAYKQQVRKGAKEGDRRREVRVNEPIYVNLVNDRGPEGSIVSAGSGHKDEKIHGSPDLMIMKLDQKQLAPDRSQRTATEPQYNYHHHNQAEFSGLLSSNDASGRRRTKLNSIDQFDYYRCLNLQNSTQADTSLVESGGYYDYDDNDYYYDDGDVDGRTKETFELSPNGPDNNNMLNRGYSVRINSRNSNGCSKLVKCNQLDDLNRQCGNQKMATTAGAKVQTSSSSSSATSGEMIDEIELSSLSPRHPLSINTSKSQQHFASVLCDQPQKRRIVLASENKHRFESRKSNCDWNTNQFRQQQPKTKDFKRLTMQNSNAQLNIDHSPKLGSQINSKSAYDLRLDLSHFFS